MGNSQPSTAYDAYQRKKEAYEREITQQLILEPRKSTAWQNVVRYAFNPPTIVSFLGRLALTGATAWATYSQEPFVFWGVLSYQLFNTVTSTICVSMLWNIDFKVTAWLMAVLAILTILPSFIILIRRHFLMSDIIVSKTQYRPPNDDADAPDEFMDDIF